MSVKRKIVLASNNKGKIAEFQKMLAPLNWEVLAQGDCGVSEVNEVHHTFLENALLKARHASEVTGLPALADDSGIVVEALNGQPGVYSARYALMNGREKGDVSNNAYLIEQLQGCANRRASYVAVLVFLNHAQDPNPLVAQGIWTGEIVDDARGEHGFGYDPHFYLPDLGCTAAQLSPEQKNTYSHRAQALKKLFEMIHAVD
ncbi:RdgB/HAM1 family non-canonical purine NTP pyrophosphatase [Basilea psittacipulmonis]|uniref:dITP/XTP pyrophosphatase n=1 Tax=Basilea psittacipulmonis DSM 24701 TaxID=1072685 RepID=A0A077DDC0_9BURK|nr:RdgB/HAM1 family non-canonical purine NTP pyrophosphatase [Basilea psittacipulmonis]AIL32609.1 nucleoside-triphosphate diphosphatase [Basilea psittacipulmonis DSM 24701]